MLNSSHVHLAGLCVATGDEAASPSCSPDTEQLSLPPEPKHQALFTVAVKMLWMIMVRHRKHMPSNHSRLFFDLCSSAPKPFLIKRRGILWHQNQPPWRDSYTLKRQDSFFQIRQKRGSNLHLCFCPASMNPWEQTNPRATGCTRQGRFPSLSLSLPHFFWPEILSGPAKLFPWNSHKKLQFQWTTIHHKGRKRSFTKEFLTNPHC